MEQIYLNKNCKRRKIIMEKQYFIYLTTNLINNKKYIGYHNGSPEDNYLGSGQEILKAIKKYGKNNFERKILEFCIDKQDAFNKEKKWIKYYNAVEDKNFYNISEGGEYDSGWEQLKKWKEKNPEKAKEMYKRNGERLKKWWNEHPEKILERNENFNKAGIKWWKEHPEELQQQMKKVNEAKEKWQKEHPQEYQEEVKQWIKAGSIANSQKVRCTTTGEIFASQCEAARYYNIPQGNISKVLKGKRKSAGKHPITGKKLYWELVKE